MRTARIIEALLFASDAPLTAADLTRAAEELDEDDVEAAIQELRAEYDAAERAFQVYELAGGYQLLTRPEFKPHLERFETVPQPNRLSRPALEVLAIVAYRQPIGRAEIEDIRGVSSAGVLRTLQDRGLIDVVGRGEGLGRPLLYGTSRKFLEHMGIRSLDDLPRPDELPIVLTGRALESSPEGADEVRSPAGVAPGEGSVAAEAPVEGGAGVAQPEGSVDAESANAHPTGSAGPASEPPPRESPPPATAPSADADEV